MKRQRRTIRYQAGFTIVELMIATMVFSVVIFIITAGVLTFTHSYYRGVTSSTTQNTARGIMDAISQAIQFSGKTVVETNLTTDPTADPYNGFFCAGDYVYMFSLGKQLPDSPIRGDWGLYRATKPVADTCAALGGPTSDGTELLGPHMRVANISVAPASGSPAGSRLYTVSIRLAYGDSDLLCSPAINGTLKGGCQKGAISYDPDDIWYASDMTCKSQTGSQFCAVSALSTTVFQRVKPYD